MTVLKWPQDKRAMLLRDLGELSADPEQAPLASALIRTLTATDDDEFHASLAPLANACQEALRSVHPTRYPHNTADEERPAQD